jgi:hypothetical protein
MRPRPGCGPLSREVGFPSVGPPMADPSVQFPESRFHGPEPTDTHPAPLWVKVGRPHSGNPGQIAAAPLRVGDFRQHGLPRCSS